MQEPTKTEGIAQSLTPYYVDGGRRDSGKKLRYLSYIICNFSVREAAKLAKVTERMIRYWREQDPNFAEIEQQGFTDLRKQLSKEFIDIEYTRNFRLFLAKDFNVLYKDAAGGLLTDREQQYLLQIRKFYTPQQLAMIKEIIGGGDGATEAFDFTRTVLTIRLEKEQGILKEA